MLRCCWSLSRQATLPLRLRVSRAVVVPAALHTSPRLAMPCSCMGVKPLGCISGTPSLLHTSTVFFTADEKPPSSLSSEDKAYTLASSPAETTGEDILDESGFKLEWEEPTGGEEAGQDGEEKAAILVAALRQVTKHGWSEEALREGARSVGVAELDDGLFPNGGGDLVQYFEKQCHDDLVQYLQDLSKEKRGACLLRAAVEYRLRMIGPYQESWPQAMAMKALLSNVPWSLQNLGVVIDEIWYWAGDRSTDINWYSKRATLASIYIATELFMIQDKSEDYLNTWKFLDQRFKDINEFGTVSGQIEGVFMGSMDLLKSAITLGSQFACRARK